MAVLLEQRLVEIQGVPKLCQFTRSGAFAEHLFHRVAGDDVNHQENKREDEPESGESQEEALREVPGDLEELLQERTPVDSLSPVSYTHLDVYKRQGEVDADGSSIQIARKDGKTPLVFDIHTLKLTSVSRTKAMSYAVFLNNALPSGEIRAHGEFGPWNSGDAGRTLASGQYTFQKADLGNFNGIAGMLAARGEFQGKLGHLETKGSMNIPDFMVTRSKHAVRVTTEYHAFVDGTNGDVTLERVNAAFLKTRVVANGKIAGHAGQDGKTTTVDLRVQDGLIQDCLLYTSRCV